MIYVTGDLHGDIDRFKSRKTRRLKKNDTLIVCGDFGFLWDGSKRESKLLKWIGRRRFNVLFVEGTHDNLDLLEQYPLVQWNGGMVHEISGRLRHLCRGCVFEIEGSKLFVFGGGGSSDADSRGQRWWSGELPTAGEIQAGREALAAHGGRVDFIITHQCSRKLKKFLTMDDNDVNVLETFLDEVRDQCRFTRWYFGSYHINKVIPPNEMALYDAVVPIGADKL